MAGSQLSAFGVTIPTITTGIGHGALHAPATSILRNGFLLFLDVKIAPGIAGFTD